MKKAIMIGLIIMLLATVLLTGCQVAEDKCTVDSDCSGSQLCCPIPINEDNPSYGFTTQCEEGPVCP